MENKKIINSTRHVLKFYKLEEERGSFLFYKLEGSNKLYKIKRKSNDMGEFVCTSDEKDLIQGRINQLQDYIKGYLKQIKKLKKFL